MSPAAQHGGLEPILIGFAVCFHPGRHVAEEIGPCGGDGVDEDPFVLWGPAFPGCDLLGLRGEERLGQLVEEVVSRDILGALRSPDA